MYLLFSKKQQGDKKIYSTTRLVSNFYKFLLSKNLKVFLIGLPGYISKNTRTIDKFYNDFCTECAVNNIQGYFFRPMNICKLKGSITNIDYFNSKFGNYNTIYRWKKDHSKTLLFIDTSSLFFKKDKTFIINFDKAKVYGVLIGSSNQSYNTYFGYGLADKGEADVLIINDNINAECNNKLVQDEEMLDFYRKIQEPKLILAKQMVYSLINLNDCLKDFIEIKDSNDK